jgi:hypothetical protein
VVINFFALWLLENSQVYPQTHKLSPAGNAAPEISGFKKLETEEFLVYQIWGNGPRAQLSKILKKRRQES